MYNVSKNIGISLIVAFFLMLEYLPVIKLLPNHFYFGIRIFLTILFFVITIKNNFFEFKKYIAIILIAVGIETLVYFDNFIRILRYDAYIIPAMLCFIYATMGTYFYKYSSRSCKKFILYFIVILTLITSVTTLNGLIDFPLAVRSLGNGGNTLIFDSLFYYGKNMAGWGMIYGFVFLLPSLVINYKKTRKIIFFITIIISEVMIISSQIMFAILFSILLLYVSIFEIKTYTKMIMIICLLLVIFGIVFSFREDIFLMIMSFFSNVGNEKSALRLSQLYMLFDSGMATGDADARFELYMMSFNTFLDNPIFGYDESGEIMYKNIGMHSQILDLFASVGGVLGGCWIGIFFYLIFDFVKSILDDRVRFMFVIYIALLFLLMFLNPTVFDPEIFLLVFLMPSFVDAN